jgi:hypothetical protein
MLLLLLLLILSVSLGSVLLAGVSYSVKAASEDEYNHAHEYITSACNAVSMGLIVTVKIIAPAWRLFRYPGVTPACISRRDGQIVHIMDLIAADYARTVASAHGDVSNMSSALFGSPHRSPRDHQRAGGGRGRGIGRLNGGNSGSTFARNQTTADCDVVNIMYWNIYHNFTLKLTDPEFHDVLHAYDIMFFAETTCFLARTSQLMSLLAIQWSHCHGSHGLTTRAEAVVLHRSSVTHSHSRNPF